MGDQRFFHAGLPRSRHQVLRREQDLHDPHPGNELLHPGAELHASDCHLVLSLSGQTGGDLYHALHGVDEPLGKRQQLLRKLPSLHVRRQPEQLRQPLGSSDSAERLLAVGYGGSFVRRVSHSKGETLRGRHGPRDRRNRGQRRREGVEELLIYFINLITSSFSLQV